ncbi:MAG: T9SS type A sorting domain-containing protein [Chitinophagales bacterium]
MKTASTIIIFLCAILTAKLFAQAPAPSWQYVDGTSTGLFYSTIQTSDGGMLAVGYTIGPQHGPDSLDQEGYHYGTIGYYEEAWVVKRSSTGALDWGHCYGGTNGSSEALTVCQSPDGGFVIGGWSEASNYDVPSNNGYEDMWYFKIDSVGNIVWKKSFGTFAGVEQVNGLTPIDGGGYLLSGEYFAYQDIVMKLNESGDTVWTRTYHPANYQGYAEKSIQLPDGGFIIAESLYDYFGLDNPYYTLTRIDSSGSKLWQKTIHLDSSAEQSVCDFVRCSDGGYALSGYIQGVVGGVVYFPEIFVMRCDSSGNFDWEKTYGTSGYDFGYTILQDADDNLLVGGYVETADTTFPQHNSQAYLLKLNNNDGSEIWFETYPEQAFSFNDGLSSFHHIVKTSGGGIMAAGQYNCGHGYSLDNQCSYTGGIEGYMVRFPDLGAGISNLADLSSGVIIYPDPVSDQVNLEITQPKVFPLELRIFNDEGQQMISEKLISAQQSVNVQSLPAGIYLVRLMSNNSEVAHLPFIKE